MSHQKYDTTSHQAVFVGDLAADVSDQVLLTTFQQRYPSISSAKVVLDHLSGQSKGYGFVRFGSEEEAQRAMQEMQGFMLNGRPLKLNIAASRKILQQLQAPTESNPNADYAADPFNTTLYVGGIGDYVDEYELRRHFQVFGNILYVKIPVGKKCGFICFARKEDAERALTDMNGTLIGASRVKISWGRTSTGAVIPTMLQQHQQQQQQITIQTVAAIRPAAHTPPTNSSPPQQQQQQQAQQQAYWYYYQQQQQWQAYQQQQQQQALLKQQQDELLKFDCSKDNDKYVQKQQAFGAFFEMSFIK